MEIMQILKHFTQQKTIMNVITSPICHCLSHFFNEYIVQVHFLAAKIYYPAPLWQYPYEAHNSLV